MLKLMKYELRKMRTTLLVLLGLLVALEAGFLIGYHTNKSALMAPCLTLIALMAFVVYGYILVAGIVSYSRELREKTGYLVFMVPVSPLGVVLSKLVFTALAALCATALFGLFAWYDLRLLARYSSFDPQLLEQINNMLRLGLGPNASVQQIARSAGFTVLTWLIEITLTMCTAYLSITLSATLLGNKKGFLRGLISVALFIALTWGSSRLSQVLFYDRISISLSSLQQMTSTLIWSLLLNFALCALFAFASAWLLERKVDL